MTTQPNPLHIAAGNGDLDTVKQLIDKGTDFNVRDDGMAPLHVAAERGYFTIVDYLVSKGATINIQDKKGQTPLHLAAKKGRFEKVLGYLIDKGADINIKDNEGLTPLHIAIEELRVKTAEFLVNKRANVNSKDKDGMTPLHVAAKKGECIEIVIKLKDKRADINIKDNNGQTPLHTAAKVGNEYTMRELVELGANMNIKDNDGMAPLHVAAERGYFTIVDYLVSKGAAINIRDKKGQTPLHLAAKKGRFEKVLGYLIDKGAGINIKDNEGLTPLHIAVEELRVMTAKFLVNEGANVNSKDNDGMTPLHVAAKKGECIEGIKLIHNGADINIKDNNGQTPLHTAAKVGNEYTMRELVKLGAHMNIKDNDGISFCVRYINIKDKDGMTPLHLAAKIGRVQIVNYLCVEGADINIQDNDAMTPLHLAVESNHIEMVVCLLDQRADINVQDDNERTPLHVAASKGHDYTVECLVKKGANMNIKDKNGKTPLHVAANNGHDYTVECLVKKGADMNSKDKTGIAPLHLAAKSGHVQIVNYLGDEGADINIQDNDRQTPLHVAASNGRDYTVACLVKKGADMNIKDKTGMTALHLAAEGGHIKIVTHLCDKGADFNIQDNDGQTPLHVAASKSRDYTVEWLVKKGADINIKDKTGWTPLHCAAIQIKEGIVQLLIEKGADMNIKDINGETALDLATQWGHEAVVAYLKRAADPNILEESESTGKQQESSPQETDNYPSEEPPATAEKEETEESDHEEIDLQVKELLEKYHNQTKIKHKSLKCLFTGPPRVGKTTLKKRLLRVIKNLITSGVVSPSGGLEKPISVIIGETRECVTVVMESDLDWKPQHDLLDEAQIVLEFVDKSDLQTSRPATVLPKPVSPTPFQAPAVLAPATPVATTAVPSKSGPDSPTPRESEADTLDDAKKLMQEVLSSRKLCNIKDIEKTTTLYFMDTGGQPEFHEIMPIILNGPALHLIFFNLAFDLDEPIPIRFCHEDGTDGTITYVSSYTGKQMIFQLLSSLYYFSKSLSPDSEPAAVLIGTHLDQLKGQDEMKVNDFLNRLLNKVEFHDRGFLTYPTKDKSTIFIPINNYSGDEEEIHQLQTFLRQIIGDRFSPVELPSSWLFFHLLLRHHYENSPGVCKLAECRALARGCGLDEDDVPQVLRYIHQHLGTILFYEDVPGLNELVICDPNVLFKSIYQLVAVSFVGDKGYHTIAAEIRKTGEIHARVLKRISTQSSSSLLKNEHIIELLMHFKILTKLPSDDGVIYFMPCLLRPNNSLELSCKALQTLYPPPLLVRFKGNYIPMGLFSALVVGLLHHPNPCETTAGMKLLESSWELDQDERYRNHIVFNMDDDFSVELIVHPAYLEFRIRITNPTEEDAEEIHQFCMMVCKTVVDTLISALELHAHTKKTKFQLGFYCSGSFQADSQPHFCRLSNQRKVNPKTFASSDSPHCQDQCCLPPESTIWLEQWKNNKDTRDQGHASVPIQMKLRDIQNDLGDVTDWYQLGVQLGISTADLDQIQMNCSHNAQQCKTKVLDFWLRNSPERTWAKLAQAVEAMGGYAVLAEELRKRPKVSGNQQQRKHSSRETDSRSDKGEESEKESHLERKATCTTGKRRKIEADSRSDKGEDSEKESHLESTITNSREQKITADHAARPTLIECIRFRGRERRINIPQEIGVQYRDFGLFLLDDPNGARIRALAHKHNYDSNEINIEIIEEWITGRGKHPVTWKTLTQVLRDIELSRLAEEIEAIKC